MNEELPRRALAVARGWIGTPYHHQASVRGVGCDCLGLVRGVWRELDGNEVEPLPAYTRDWAEASGTETLIDAARRHLTELDPGAERPGDVVILRFKVGLPAKHCGIIGEAGTLIHALEGAGVTEVPLGPWWRRRIVARFRFPLRPSS